jgi:hypothetical protein
MPVIEEVLDLRVSRITSNICATNSNDSPQHGKLADPRHQLTDALSARKTARLRRG